MRAESPARAALAAIAFLYLSTGGSARAQEAAGVAGRVVDKSGDPVPGALVTFDCASDTPRVSVRTDENGRFQSPRLPEGECSVEASLPVLGCRSAKMCRTSGGTVQQIDLELDLDMVQERVVVIGSPVRDSVESREIRESFSHDAGEAIARLSGVHKIRKGGIANDVVLRGFKGDNVSVLIDGHRLYGACPNRMDPPAFHVDFAEVERIEVKKGPFDMFHGGSLGGLVNIVTREPEPGVHGGVQVSAGSFGYVAPSITGSFSKSRLSVKGGYASRRGEPFEDGDGVPFTRIESAVPSANYKDSAVDQRAFDVKTGWLGATAVLAPGHRLEVQATRQEGDAQLYPYLLMDAVYDDASRVSAEYHAQGPLGVVRNLDASVAYGAVDHYMTDALRLSSVGTPRDYGMGTDADSKVRSGRIQATLGAGLTVGIDAYQRDWTTTTRMAGMAYAPQASIPEVRTEAVGLYAHHEAELSEAWRLQAGVRFDRARSAANAALANTDLYYAYHGSRAASATDTDPSASLSVTYVPVKSWELFAGLGRTVRPPDPQERYFALKRKDADWVGNPGLVPVKNTEMDAGARFHAGSLSVDIDLYSAEVADFIAIVDQPRINIVPGVTNPVARSYVNNDARMWGGEAGVRWSIGRFVLAAGFSYVRGEQDVDPGKGVTDPDLAEMPPLRGRASARFDTERWFVEAEGVAAARQDHVDESLLETPTPGWGTLNLRGGASLRHFSVVAGVDNVFDRFYREHLSYYRDPFRSGANMPEPGLSFSASLLLRY